MNSDTNIFEQASRRKLRFDTTKGMLSVEDLWDLPLTSPAGKANLDDVAKSLYRQVKELGDSISFVTPPPSENNADLRLAFEVVKHVITVRVRERDEKVAASDRAARKQQLLEVLSRKETAQLESKSPEEIRAMIDAL